MPPSCVFGRQMAYTRRNASEGIRTRVSRKNATQGIYAPVWGIESILLDSGNSNGKKEKVRFLGLSAEKAERINERF